MSPLPDSGMDTKIAVLRGQIQGLTNEFRFSSKSQGERLGDLESQSRSQQQEIAELRAEIKVLMARMSTIGGGASLALLLIQIWFNTHR